MTRIAEITIRSYPTAKVGEGVSKEKFLVKYDDEEIDFVRLRFLDFINWYFDMERREKESRIKEAF